MISFPGILLRYWPEVQYSYFVEHCLMTIQKILKYAIAYYISRHCFSSFLFDWYCRNKKSQNSSSFIVKEQNDKKGGWFNWLFQTFKTIKVVVVHRESVHRKCKFNLQFKIEIEKDIFAHFNFNFKIENWKMMKNFQFSIPEFYWKIENRKFMFRFSVFEFNCRITQVEKPWLVSVSSV